MNINKGFTLIEAITAIMIISVIASSIMMGITTVEKKLFKIRLKEKAFEELKNYTDFMASRLMVGDMGEIPRLNPPDQGYKVIIYQKLKKNESLDVYSANISYEPIIECGPCGKGAKKFELSINNKAKVYQLNTSIIWPNEQDIKDTLWLSTYQIGDAIVKL